jgi:lysophospholipase L1-like esterase
VDYTPEFNDQTLRYIVHTSIGGNQVRVQISNTFGTEPLVIGAAHIARRMGGASIDPSTDRPLTFGGEHQVTIPVGAPVLSDPVELEVPALSDLAVSLYLPQPTTADTMHLLALQTNYVTYGNATGALDLPDATTTTSWHFLTRVDVQVDRRLTAVVALGDSITDGANSTVDANRRWPDVLAARFQEGGRASRFAVINEGIIGSRILHPTETQYGNLFGPSALARFDRDVLAQPGISHVIVLLGINDIGHPGADAPDSEEVTAQEIARGLLQFVQRAHEKGIKVFGATLTPFEDTTLPGFYSPDKELKRQAVNHWIRTSDAFDEVIDFDAVIRDPTHPERILPIYDGGDHLHPSDAGQQAMGEAIPLELFKNPCHH